MAQTASEKQASSRFFAVAERNRLRYPSWLKELSRPSARESEEGAHAVAVTDAGRFPICLVSVNGGLERLNQERPGNDLVSIIIFPRHTDSEVWSKSLHFIGKRRERQRREGQRRPR